MRGYVSRRRGSGLLAAALVLALGSTANAAPINYVFASGTVDVTVTAGAEILVGTTTLDFGGATATFDPTTGILSDFDWTLSAVPVQTLVFGTGPGATLGTYGGFTSVDLNSASLTPNTSPLYSPGVPFPAGGGDWFISVSNVLSSGTFTGHPGAVGPVPFPPYNNGSMSGSVTTGGLFTFSGVTIGQLPGSLFPIGCDDITVICETDDLQINASLAWQGTPAPVPEPGALGLLGLMSALLVARRFIH